MLLYRNNMRCVVSELGVLNVSMNRGVMPMYGSCWVYVRRLKHTVSKLYQPKELTPQEKLKTAKKIEEASCKSSRLMKEYGIIKSVGNGYFALLPLAIRSINKLTKIIDEELESVGCQRLILPHTATASLWKQSGRWQGMGPELIRYKDRHDQDMLLCPTHEETITSLVAAYDISSRELPLRLYQIGSKFRAEMKPRFGLIRANEFLMKDLYTFDKDLQSAKHTYDQISLAYEKIFNRIGVPYLRVEGDTGMMGGSSSHEYHFPAGIGQDSVLWCKKCSKGRNLEIDSEDNTLSCDRSDCEIEETKGIEVGHTFLLGQKYSKVFKANYLGDKGKPEILEMGCYGIGVSRVLAAAAEVLSTETELRWPKSIAPFSVCIIPPKSGSKEEPAGLALMEELYSKLNSIFPDDIIIDDREKMTIGRKLYVSRRTGYSIIIVIGKKSVSPEPTIEIEIPSEERKIDLTPDQALAFLHNFNSS